jgi:hypothetical protein
MLRSQYCNKSNRKRKQSTAPITPCSVPYREPLDEPVAATEPVGAPVGSGGDRNGSNGSSLTANSGLTTPPSETAMVPSWRLAEESAKKREALQRVRELELELAEIRGAMRSKRDEWCFRGGKAVNNR